MKITKNNSKIFNFTRKNSKIIKQNITTKYVLGPNDTLIIVLNLIKPNKEKNNYNEQ